jgi:hypothetical protein
MEILAYQKWLKEYHNNMSLFTTNYSTIITKGLGGNALCSLILAQFSLTGFCSIVVVPPPPNIASGGGGWSPNGGFYVPFPKQLNQQTRMILITVKFSEKHTYRKSYVVGKGSSGIVIRAINFTNSVKDKITIGVDKIQQVGKKVSAIFKKVDK